MLDRVMIPIIRRPLSLAAQQLVQAGVTANQVTLAGFVIGMLSLPLLAMEQYLLALLAITINRIADGLDGAVARIQGITDSGGFLDIGLDFIFYSAVVFGFALADPGHNALAAAFLIFSFIGTGTSFLSFAAVAGKRGIENPVYRQKSLYYMGGLTEGTETITLYVLCCLFPAAFPWFAWIFGGLCWLTTATRLFSGYKTLKEL